MQIQMLRRFVPVFAMLLLALWISACGAPPADSPAGSDDAASEAEAAEEGAAEGESAEGPLIHPLEGPTLVLDPAQFPTEFNEAPMLAERVAAGELPPVEERLPDREDLLVIEPMNEIGKYGGTWRRGFSGPADGENMMRINSSSRLLNWDYGMTAIVPSIIKDWEMEDDFKKYILHLRKGAKWSDGEPLTADDFLFWYEDVAMNEDIWPSPPPELVVAGEVGVMEKIDDFTVAYTFASPYPPVRGHSRWP
ncbi:hypothetical protein KFU94_54805 [Chloroflexi bacterium TSY]|nr:hypothetical protein [Chloroflexi bacterium TSY]